MHFFRIFFLSILSVFNLFGQHKPDTVFRRPLDISPVLLSGTFAELRPNHFHSGIDFRTQGTTGHKVYACDNGYVSRISISGGGYGKALYVTHPGGYTTVYAHLDGFNDAIAAYVKQQQYRREQFAVNLFPDSALLPVRRGEVIAFSGNTGGSSGPHLHFEVRETKTEIPLNPLLFEFGVKDNIAPTIRQLAVYPIGKESTVNGSTEKLVLDLERAGKSYRIAGNRKPIIKGKAAFGIETYDQTNGSANRCGPSRIRFWVDSVLIFSQTMNRVSFDEMRYVNSLIDYSYYVNNRVRFNRLYIEPNNRLSIYDRHIERGIVSFPDSAEHKASVVVSDLNGNSARLNFSFLSVPDRTPSSPPMPDYSKIIAFPDFSKSEYGKELVFTRPGVKVTIPADALYDIIDLQYGVSRRLKGLYSEVHRIHDAGTPLHKAMTVEIAADSLPERLRDKAAIVQIEPNGRRSYAGGAYRNGAVRTESRLFGDFAVAVDTVPPRITPVNIKNGADRRGAKDIRFKIKDDFSGIDTYNGRIDGQWALFEYDAKNDLIFYDFDAERLTKNTKHTLTLQVTDNKGNATEYKVGFTW